MSEAENIPLLTTIREEEPLLPPPVYEEIPPPPIKKGDLSKFSVENIIEGKRARRPPKVWVHEDEAEVLQNSSYDAEAYEEACMSDSEIPQTDDEEEQEQIRKEVMDSDDEEAIVPDEDASEDDDWRPTDDDEEEEEEDDDDDDDDDEPEEPAAAMLLKFEGDDTLMYHLIDAEGFVFESSIDHLSTRESIEIALKTIDSETTVIICLEDEYIRKLIEVLRVQDTKDTLFQLSETLCNSEEKLLANSLRPIGKTAIKKINRLVSDRDLVHFFFFD